MAIKVEELKRWLESLDDEDLIHIEGIALVYKDKDYEAYLQIGEQ